MVKSKPTPRMPQGRTSAHRPVSGLVGEMTRVKTLDPKGTMAVDTVPVSGRCEALVSTSAAELVALPK